MAEPSIVEQYALHAAKKANLIFIPRTGSAKCHFRCPLCPADDESAFIVTANPRQDKSIDKFTQNVHNNNSRHRKKYGARHATLPPKAAPLFTYQDAECFTELDAAQLGFPPFNELASLWLPYTSTDVRRTNVYMAEFMRSFANQLHRCYSPEHIVLEMQYVKFTDALDLETRLYKDSHIYAPSASLIQAAFHSANVPPEATVLPLKVIRDICFTLEHLVIKMEVGIELTRNPMDAWVLVWEPLAIKPLLAEKTPRLKLVAHKTDDGMLALHVRRVSSAQYVLLGKRLLSMREKDSFCQKPDSIEDEEEATVFREDEALITEAKGRYAKPIDSNDARATAMMDVIRSLHPRYECARFRQAWKTANGRFILLIDGSRFCMKARASHPNNGIYFEFFSSLFGTVMDFCVFQRCCTPYEVVPTFDNRMATFLRECKGEPEPASKKGVKRQVSCPGTGRYRFVTLEKARILFPNEFAYEQARREEVRRKKEKCTVHACGQKRPFEVMVN